MKNIKSYFNVITFSILNTLDFIENGDGYYCYCEEMIQKNCGVKSKPRWKSGHC